MTLSLPNRQDDLPVMMKTTNRILSRLLRVYEGRGAAFIASRLGWLYWPLAKACQALRIRFVANVSEGTGHVLVELDHFLRQRHLGLIPPGKRYVWVTPERPLAGTCATHYGHHFFRAVSSNVVYFMLLPMIMKYREITVDVGLSRSKRQLPTGDNDVVSGPVPRDIGDVYWITRGGWATSWRRYVAMRERTSGYRPLRDCRLSRDPHLEEFIGETRNRLALIHINEVARNACGRATDPASYLQSLEYLREQGLSPVLVGRERMPEEFKRFGVLDYANWPYASFGRDLLLFSIAKVALMSASGAAYLADAMDVPYLYINSWHLSVLMPSDNCINVPALVRGRDGRLLSFREQMSLYWESDECSGDVFPMDRYEAVNATSDDILQAMKELMGIGKRDSNARKLEEAMWSDDSLVVLRARISDQFLRRHADLVAQ